MEQGIFRIQKDKDNPYVMVNKQLLNNTELSWKAKGLLTYLLSLPDNWKIYEDEIVKHAKDGKDSLKSAIKELIANGYIERERIRSATGQLRGYAYCVYEIPNQDGKSNNGKSINGKSIPTNNNYTNINGTNNENNNNGTKSDDIRTQQLEPYTEGTISVVNYYYSTYRRYFGEDHPNLKKKQIQTVMRNISNFMSENMLDEGGLEAMIDRHFERTHLTTDYNINHFATEGIMANLIFEAGLH